MNRVRDLRLERGLSQEALARKAGLSLGAVRQVETGRRRPRLRTARAIAHALGVSVDEVFPEELEEERSTEG